MDHEGYYAESFFPDPGQCFRMVSSSTHGSPILCPSPVEFRGRFQDGTGRWHEVWSCIKHAGDLTDWKRVSASVTHISDAPNHRSGIENSTPDLRSVPVDGAYPAISGGGWTLSVDGGSGSQ